MPTDVRELLERGAPTPLRDVDIDAVSARGRQWRRRRSATAAAAVAAVVALAVLPLPGMLSPPTRIVFDQPAAPVEPALAYGVDGDIYVANWNGANPVRIADGGPEDGMEGCPEAEQRDHYTASGSAWSPDGAYLAYWNWRPCPAPPNEWGTVIISDPQGNVVASFPGEGWLISWSPDSTRVAVWDSWDPEGDSTVGVYELDGERQATLTVPASLMPSGDVSPVWSRDGSSLLLRDVQVPLDGPPRRLPDDLSHSYQGYSPDGTRLASIDRGSLVVAEAEGSDDRKVGSAAEFWDTAWSPSGDRVAFIHEELSGEVDSDGLPVVLSSELRVKDVATGAETSLVDANASAGLRVIEFSPDGDRILYSRDADTDAGVDSLWSINADGSEPRRLVPRTDWADWRPSPPR